MAPIPSPADLVRRSGWTATTSAETSARPRAMVRGVVIGAIVTVVALAAKGALVTGTEAGVAYLPMFAAIPVAALIGEGRKRVSARRSIPSSVLAPPGGAP